MFISQKNNEMAMAKPECIVAKIEDLCLPSQVSLPGEFHVKDYQN